MVGVGLKGDFLFLLTTTWKPPCAALAYEGAAGGLWFGVCTGLGGEGGTSKYDLGALDAARGGCFLVGAGRVWVEGRGLSSSSLLMTIMGAAGGVDR